MRISYMFCLFQLLLVISTVLTLHGCTGGSEGRQAAAEGPEAVSGEAQAADAPARPARVVGGPSHSVATQFGNKLLGTGRGETASAESSYTKLNIARASTKLASAKDKTPVQEDEEVVKAQARRARDVPVKCTAVVARILKEDRKGKPHQRFLLELSNGTTVLIAHNISLADRVPLSVGDMVTVKGEYVWNRKGGVIHYTHHATNLRHQGGWILHNGQRYK